jgi:hypothetical protein
VLAGTCLFITAVIVAHRDPISNSSPTSTGDYIRLFIAFILLWGPSLLIIIWWASIPAIVALGILAACTHRAPAAETASQLPAIEERSESG